MAVEHHDALDVAARLIQAHAWVGGGAPAFSTNLIQQRAIVHRAFTHALQALAALVVQQGGPTPGVPAFIAATTAISAAPNAFQGIDPRAMAALISNLDHAGHTLSTVSTRLSAELSAHGLSGQPGQTLGRVARWSSEHGQDLRRRLTRIQQIVPWSILPASVAAYDLFGAHAPGEVAQLLNRVAASDAAALRALLAVQEHGQDTGLAARVNAWWHMLAADLHERLLDLPGFGLLNGLPAIVRDQANRRWLTAGKARLTRALDVAAAELTTRGDPLLLGGWEKIAHQLRRIDYIEKKLQPVNGYPSPLLLAFDVTGHGRLIVSWGNPDTANITVTNVSGLTSGLDAAHGDLERARALWRQADATSGGKSIASITWLGYEAPQLDPGLFDPARSVAFEGAAAKGGLALAAFTDGLRASREPSSTARHVVIGHSYGSLTTSRGAGLRPGKFADELIFVGSPGVGVDHASELGVNPKHVWVGEAGGDPVAALGRFEADPGHDSFGARPFPVGREVWTAAHSCYWDADSTSLINMGHLINSHPDQLTYPKPLNNSPQLLMPEIAPDPSLKLSR